MKKIAIVAFVSFSVVSVNSFAGGDVFQELDSKMRYLNKRQSVISQNLANSNTPGYKAKDLKSQQAKGTSMISMSTTSPMHIARMNSSSGFGQIEEKDPYETKPDGNTVSIEQQTVKMSENDLEYRAAAGVFRQMNGLLRTAIGNK